MDGSCLLGHRPWQVQFRLSVDWDPGRAELLVHGALRPFLVSAMCLTASCLVVVPC